MPVTLRIGLLLLTMTMTGCSSLPTWMIPATWFADEEELAIKNLEPINAKFQPKVLWDRGVGDGVEHFFSRLSPATGYDKVFTANRQGIVAAYDPESGDRIWRINLATYRDEGYFSWITRLWADGIPARISGGLTVAYKSVFFGTENGEVIALDAETGETKWKTSVKGEVLAAPAADEGLLVVNTGSGILYALDASSGEERWTYESEVPALSLRGVSTPAIANGGAIVGTASGKIAVMIAETGQVAWEQTVAAASGATELERLVDIDSKPLVFGGVIYVVSFNGTLAAVEIRSGRTIWKRDYRSFRRLSNAGNTLFVTDDSSQIYALNRRNGVELWSQSSLRDRALTGAAVFDEYIVVGDKYGFLHWIEQSTGEIVARLDVGGNDDDEGIYVTPVVDENRIFTQTRDGELAAVVIP